MTYWISDRLPTKDDADEDGDVIICSEDGTYWMLAVWDVVKYGKLWIPFVKPGSSATIEPPTPTPRRFVSLISHSTALIAVADDGTAWFQLDSASDWHPLRALPPR
jgi:hypothetical protein